MANGISKEEFNKSLARLESLAKSQLFHTGSDSDPGNWAGSSGQDEDSMEDNIDENGTDYNGVKKALAAKVAKSQALTPAEVAIVKGESPLKLIGEKISKGESLTSAERWAIKKGGSFLGMAKGNDKPSAAGTPGETDGPSKVPDSHGGDADEEKEAEAKKSLAHAASEQPALSKGIEMSPVLYEFVRAMDIALQGTESRTATKVAKALANALTPLAQRLDSLEKALSSHRGEQGEFNKSMAEAVVGIGQQVAGGAELAAAAASAPVGPPKSQLRALPGGVSAVQKSFGGPGGLDVGEGALAKSQIVDAMCEMVKSRKLNPTDVIKFESTGEMSHATQTAVQAFIAGGR